MKYANYDYTHKTSVERAGTFSYDETKETSEYVFNRLIGFYALTETDIAVKYRQDNFDDEAAAKAALDTFMGVDWDLNKRTIDWTDVTL